jgi:hypothetical protein
MFSKIPSYSHSPLIKVPLPEDKPMQKGVEVGDGGEAKAKAEGMKMPVNQKTLGERALEVRPLSLKQEENMDAEEPEEASFGLTHGEFPSATTLMGWMGQDDERQVGQSLHLEGMTFPLKVFGEVEAYKAKVHLTQDEVALHVSDNEGMLPPPPVY